MKQKDLAAIELLEAANPFSVRRLIPEWSSEDENVLLAHLMEDRDRSSGATALIERIPVDSTPRGAAGRLRRPLLLATAACAAGGVALGIALSTSESPGAFAAWTATTSVPPAAQLAAASSGCQSSYHQATVLLPNATSGISATLTAPLRLTDSRGPFELLVYAGPSGGAVCLWDGSVLGVSGGGSLLPATTDHSIGVPTVGFERDRQTPLTYAYGPAGPRVTGVTLELTNGARVEATVRNGLYGAWWPSQTDVASAVVTSAEGTSHQEFGDLGPNNQAPPEN
jgi:hypothetical protein